MKLKSKSLRIAVLHALLSCLIASAQTVPLPTTPPVNVATSPPSTPPASVDKPAMPAIPAIPAITTVKVPRKSHTSRTILIVLGAAATGITLGVVFAHHGLRGAAACPGCQNDYPPQ